MRHASCLARLKVERKAVVLSRLDNLEIACAKIFLTSPTTGNPDLCPTVVPEPTVRQFWPIHGNSIESHPREGDFTG